MRKVILLPFISLLVLQGAAQTKTVTIQGTVKDTTVKSIEISVPLDATLSKWEDTKLDVVNGSFTTPLRLPFPSEVTIVYGDRPHFKNFIYSDAEILIDTAGRLHITGSPVQDEYEKEFLPFFQANNKLFDSLRSFHGSMREKYGDDFPKSIRDSVNLLRDTYYYQRARLLGEYIKRHPESYVALWDIHYYASFSPLHRYFDFEKLFSAFSNPMQQQSFIPVVKEKLKESAKMQVGQVFPTEFFKGYEPLQSSLQKNNRYYLIDFWYSHCAPCAREFPKLKEIYNQFHGKGFDIVSISVDKQNDKADYVAAIKKYNLAWNHVWDKDGVTAEKFNIGVFPTYILLDKNGSIINPDIQARQLEAFLKENL
jgi:thiol-disulfide isomerase/thioredoxin